MIEGWHNGFASKVEHHMTVGKFFDLLQSEQNFNEILLEKMNAGQDVCNAKKRKYRDYDKRLLNVVSMYNRDDIKQYLSNISHNIRL